MDSEVTCPKCGKPCWAPYTMKAVGKYGQVCQYQVYQHPDGLNPFNPVAQPVTSLGRVVNTSFSKSLR